MPEQSELLPPEVMYDVVESYQGADAIVVAGPLPFGDAKDIRDDYRSQPRRIDGPWYDLVAST